MATPTIAKDLQASLRRAYEEARKRHHELVTLEHILYALLDDPKASKALDACRANRKKLRTDLERFFDDAMQPVPEDIAEDPDFSPHETVAVQRALNAAAFHAMSSEMTEIDGGNLLIQILREPESHAAYLLQQAGVTRFDLKRFVSHGVGADGSEADARPARPARRPGPSDAGDEEGEASAGDGDEEGDEDGPPDPLEAYTQNLNEAAAEGDIDPLIGRDREVERTIQVLCRRRKNNPISWAIRAWARRRSPRASRSSIHEGKVPEVLKKAPRCTRSTWARCSRARSSAASSRSASRASSSASSSTTTRSCSSTRSTPSWAPAR
jgi:ATP-dependent Clp protease ATP-binding subunit ClpA